MIVYRDATPADGAELDAMARQSWLETFGPHATDAEQAEYLDLHFGPGGLLLRELAQPGHCFRVACVGERIVAYASLAVPRQRDAEPDSLQLMRLFVLADWQGKGVARALMAWAVETARAGRSRALLLTAWEGNARAIRFYRRLGLVEPDNYGFTVADRTDADVILRLALSVEAEAPA